jgi:hypothetical protein
LCGSRNRPTAAPSAPEAAAQPQPQPQPQPHSQPLSLRRPVRLRFRLPLRLRLRLRVLVSTGTCVQFRFCTPGRLAAPSPSSALDKRRAPPAPIVGQASLGCPKHGRAEYKPRWEESAESTLSNAS